MFHLENINYFNHKKEKGIDITRFPVKFTNERS